MEGPSVSKSFLKDLRLLDRRLGIKFNSEHFVVTFDRGWGEPVNIHRVKGDGGEFRQPDQRDIAFVSGGDLCKEDMKSRLRKLSMYSEKIREKAKADAYDNVRAMTRDSRVQLANAAIQLTNQGKGNSAHRRITPKPSKNAIRVIP